MVKGRTGLLRLSRSAPRFFILLFRRDFPPFFFLLSPRFLFVRSAFPKRSA